MPTAFAMAAIAFIGGIASVANAQISSLDGKTVARVAYDPARQPISDADLKRIQLVEPNAKYSTKNVGETIDRLFATGAYVDIQADAEETPEGIVVTFHTKPASFTGHVEIKGKLVSPPSRSTLLSTGDFQLGTPFDPAALAVAENSIRQLFVGNGFYNSDVHLDSQTNPETDLADITISVHTGKRARYEPPELKGDLKLSNSTIMSATGWRVKLIHRWRQVTQSLTQKGVESVRKEYQKKDRLAATVDLAGLEYDAKTNRVKPSLQIEAGPKISVKALEAKVSKGMMKKLVPVYEEGAIDNDLLFEGARNLRDHFQADGYPDVEVTFRVGPLENDERTVEFMIARGARHKLAHLEIQGNKYFDTNTIRERIFLLPASFRFRHGRYSQAYVRRDEETIASLYRSNGFRDVKVSSVVRDSYNGKADQIAVTYRIEEGPQWFIAKFSTEGFEANEAEELRDRIFSAEGQPYADVNIATDRNQILQYFDRRGFTKASLQIAITPSEKPNTVDLRYVMVRGPQQFVRDVRILGLTRTRPKVIDRHMTIHPGDPLSRVDIVSSQRELDNLGIFERVETAIQNPDGDTIQKTVLYDMQEANRYTVRVGVGAEIAQIGASTTNLNAPVGGTGFSPRFLLSMSRIDFLGLGHTINFDGRVSNLEQRAGLTYTIPDFLGVRSRSLSFSALYDLSSNVRTFTSKREEAAIQLSQKLSKPSTLLLRFAYRRVSTSNIAIPDLLIPQLVQPIRIGIFSLNYAQDRRDNPTNATRGMYNTIDAGVASKVFGSERTFVRVLARNATYHRLTKDLVLARQIEFGVIKPFSIPTGLSATDAVPLPERFFGGGNLTHRGFGENQAGPRDIGTAAGTDGTATQPTGFPLGGNAVLFHNTELRFPLFGENIGGVIFHDMGNVYSNIGAISFRFSQRDQKDFDFMEHAVGVGVRYKTPIGPVRADFGYALNPPRFVGFKGTIDQLLKCDPALPANQQPSFCVGVPQRLSNFQFFFSIGQTF
jgi:outer membrane protein insertion porin family